MIYFIQAVNGGPFKIGYSTNVPQRLIALQTSHHERLRIVASFEGDCESEAQAHQDLAAYRLGGEWFADTPEVVAYLQNLFADPPARPPSRRPHEDEMIAEAIKIIRADGRPAKELAIAADVTEKTIYNIKNTNGTCGWQTFVALAVVIPELRFAICRWLGFDEEATRAEDDLRRIQEIVRPYRKLTETVAEEGDQA